MPLVVLDTSVALPATLSPKSHPRKLLVLLAYGALTYRAEHLRLDLDELTALAAAEDGEVYGAEAHRRQIERAERRRNAMSELLPVGAPNDWCAVGFSVLFDEFERKLREAGPRIDPKIRDQDVAPLRRQIEVVCVVGPPPFDPTAVPAHTRDPADDAIVHRALLAGSDFLISDDRDIVPDGAEHLYDLSGHRMLAVTFRKFTSTYFEPRDFPWRVLDGAWLREAFARL
jgi:predicted nucleic acid-binding protein